eukprot:scaffold17823_cov32-Tisochrysis_lutea.AAC.1
MGSALESGGEEKRGWGRAREASDGAEIGESCVWRGEEQERRKTAGERLLLLSKVLGQSRLLGMHAYLTIVRIPLLL